MLLRFAERHECFFQGYLPELHSITRFDLPEEWEVRADDSSDLPVTSCHGFDEKDDRLAVTRDLNRPRHNALGDNGISKVLLPMDSGPGEAKAGSVGL